MLGAGDNRDQYMPGEAHGVTYVSRLQVTARPSPPLLKPTSFLRAHTRVIVSEQACFRCVACAWVVARQSVQAAISSQIEAMRTSVRARNPAAGFPGCCAQPDTC